MLELKVDRCAVTRLLAVMVLTTGRPVLAQQQVQVVVTAVPNPVPAGTCTGIWVEVRDEFNQRINKLASGLTLHSRSYDYSQPNAVDFTWKNNDPSVGYLCARSGAGAVTTVVTATIRGTSYSGTTGVTIQPTTPGPGAVASVPAPGAAPSATPPVTQPGAAPSATPPVTQPYAGAVPAPAQTAPPGGVAPTDQAQPLSPGTAPSSSQPQPPTTATSPGGYGQQPNSAGAPPTYGQPPVSGAPAGQTYSPPSPTSGAGAPPPANGQPPTPAANVPAQSSPPSAYPAPSAPPTPSPTMPAAGAPSTTTPGTGTSAPPVTAQADTGVKSGGGLLKKIGDHAKRKTGQVKAETADNLASATNEVIDTTLESGSGVITSTAAEGSNAARRRIGGAGKALTPSGQRGGKSSDNLAIALASGRAVLRSMRFTGTTDVLEPSARELVKRLADALKATPGTFLIEAHVDALQSPTAAQELSEHRAAAVKAALIKHGVPVARVTALGYGATRPMPEVPLDGGPPSSARIEVARTQ